MPTVRTTTAAVRPVSFKTLLPALLLGAGGSAFAQDGTATASTNWASTDAVTGASADATNAAATDDLLAPYYRGWGGVSGQAAGDVTVTTDCGARTWAEDDWPGAVALHLEGLACDSGGLSVRGLRAGAWYWTRTSPPVASPLLPAAWLHGEPANVPEGLDEIDRQERGDYMELRGNAVIVPRIGEEGAPNGGDELVSPYYRGWGGVSGQADGSVTVTSDCGARTWAEDDWPGTIALHLEGLACDSGGLQARGLRAGAWYWTGTSPPVASPLLPAVWLRGDQANVPDGLDDVERQERGTYMELRGNAVIVPHVGRAPTSWRGLTLAPENRCSPYRSDDYSYPQSVEADIVAELGGIFSPYTCEAFATTFDTDIEHIVARSEAHDSGLCAASAARKREFARDLRNLTLASPTLNRSEKRAYDAAEWMPERNRCWFAQRVLNVRLAWGLTIDQAEADALERVLAACTSTAIQCSAGAGDLTDGGGPAPPNRAPTR